MQAQEKVMSEEGLATSKSWHLYLFSALILIALGAVVVQVDQRLINRSQQDIGRELSVVLNTTEGSINQWFRDQQEIATTWSEHSEVRSSIPVSYTHLTLPTTPYV